MFQNEWMRCEERSGEWIELKRSRIICKFVNFFVFVSGFDFFRVCFLFRLWVLVFVSIYTKHETRSFRVSCSQLCTPQAEY